MRRKYSTMAILLLTLPAFAQHLKPDWDKQPAELKAIYIETRALEDLCAYGRRRVREPQLIKRIVSAKKDVDRYTSAYTGQDLNWYYWGTAFRIAYRLAGAHPDNQGYPAARRTLREGLELLDQALAETPLAAAHVKLNIYVDHVQDWLPSHPDACALIWDEAGDWVQKAALPELTAIWRFHRATVEVRLLAAANALPRDDAAACAAARLRGIAEYITDEAVDARHRSTALRCLADHLDSMAEVRRASPLAERFPGCADATPDYYYARMLTALYGHGNWDRATDTLDRMNRALAGRRLKPSDRRIMDKALDLYYGNLFLPGIELQRIGTSLTDAETNH